MLLISLPNRRIMMVPNPNCYDDYKCWYPPCNSHVHWQAVLLSAIHLHDLEVQVDTFHQHTAKHSQKQVMEQHSNHVAYNLSKWWSKVRFLDQLDQYRFFCVDLNIPRFSCLISFLHKKSQSSRSKQGALVLITMIM